MSTFSLTIVRLLNDYKTIIRKHLTRNEWAKKVTSLGLKRKILKQDKDAVLYQKAQKVLTDLTHQLNQDPDSPSWYSGLDEFCQHLKSILNEYQIENNQVIHTSQKASRAIVEAFQLMKEPSTCTGNISHKLDQCGQTIARYGTREQQEMFSKALKNYQHHNINFFLPLLRNFEKYLHNFAAFFTDKQWLDL